MLIDGVHIPITSPFYRDGQLYLRKLEHNVARYCATPAAGLVAFSDFSEADALSDAEYADSLQAIAAHAAAEKVLVAGITRPSVLEALRLAGLADAADFDAVLLGAPSNWAELLGDCDLAKIQGYFRAVADGSPLPVLLFSAAGAPGLQLPVHALAGLATHPNIWGLYDTALTLDRLQQLQAATALIKHEAVVTTIFAPVTRRMVRASPAAGPASFVSAAALSGGGGLAVAPPRTEIKTRTKTVGFQVIAAGSTAGAVELLKAGVAGMLPEIAACAPQGCFEAYAAYKDGNVGLATEKAARLTEADLLMRSLGIAGMKYGCDFNGYYGGVPRLPRVPLTADERSQVEKVLAGIRN